MPHFGPLPATAVELINVARLRAEAMRLGIREILQNRREVKITPVALKASEEVRLRRVSRDSVVRGSALFVPPPEQSPATVIAQLLSTLWPENSPSSE